MTTRTPRQEIEYRKQQRIRELANVDWNLIRKIYGEIDSQVRYRKQRDMEVPRWLLVMHHDLKEYMEKRQELLCIERPEAGFKHFVDEAQSKL